MQNYSSFIAPAHSTPALEAVERVDPYQVELSQAAVDEAWDGFLAETPGGHHLQTSLWARTKAPLGWRVARAVVRRGDRIVAGAQLLHRPISILGSVGYVSRGPLLAFDEPALREAMLRSLRDLARVHRIQYLMVQPPLGGESFVDELVRRGCRPAAELLEPHPSATVMVDLAPEPDELLASMKKTTRYNVRKGQRNGATIREGSDADLAVFHRLLAATGERQSFGIPSQAYFADMWRIMAPAGHLKLFLAEYEGEVVSAGLMVAFGDTVTYKRGAWSGRHGDRHPNELMHWTVMQWAKEQGYRYYDFDGIEAEVAQVVLRDGALPANLPRTVTTFKLGFGGKVVLSPGGYEWIENRLLRWGYYTVLPRVMQSPAARRITKSLRAR
jgi:lipid II:glycine glycyltransferase (peptidoglycan interpeptide bridge formation enzyme)